MVRGAGGAGRLPPVTCSGCPGAWGFDGAASIRLLFARKLLCRARDRGVPAGPRYHPGPGGFRVRQLRRADEQRLSFAADLHSYVMGGGISSAGSIPVRDRSAYSVAVFRRESLFRGAGSAGRAHDLRDGLRRSPGDDRGRVGGRGARRRALRGSRPCPKLSDVAAVAVSRSATGCAQDSTCGGSSSSPRTILATPMRTTSSD